MSVYGKSEKEWTIFCLALSVSALMAGFTLGALWQRDAWKREAVRHGAARFIRIGSVDKFEWIEKP